MRFAPSESWREPLRELVAIVAAEPAIAGAIAAMAVLSRGDSCN
jgi:hypothetical protein